MQGFATGDLMPEVLGQLHREIHSKNLLKHRLLPINTVHDSIIFDADVRGSEVMLCQMGIFIRDIMEDVPTYMYERFGVTIDLPLTVDLEYGETWADMKHLEIK
jgi:DNA polymerase I-like protein with 3'-5' exonuclease and polymerase domains